MLSNCSYCKTKEGGSEGRSGPTPVTSPDFLHLFSGLYDSGLLTYSYKYIYKLYIYIYISFIHSFNQSGGLSPYSVTGPGLSSRDTMVTKQKILRGWGRGGESIINEYTSSSQILIRAQRE